MANDQGDQFIDPDTAASETLTDTTPPAAAPEPATPEVPEKFRNADGTANVDELLKAHAALEQKLGAPPAAETPPAATPPVDPNAPPPTPVEAATAHYEQHGEITEDHYKSLADAGISREIVDQYISNYQSGQTASAQQIYGAVGGEEQYTKVVTWAAANIPESEQSAYNAAIDSGNVEQAKLILGTIKAKHDRAMGVQPNYVGGKPAAHTPSAPYASKAEMVADMSNPQYAADPAFRSKVAARLAVSPDDLV